MNSFEDNLDWEDDLGDLLRELSDVQDQLLDVLARKRCCMAAGDLDGMQQLQSHEQELGARLQTCHERRGELLAQTTRQGLPGESLTMLATALPDDRRERVGRQLRETSSRTRLLQHNSLTNWVLAQRSLLHLSQMLEIIATGGRPQPTYGKSPSVHSRGALVDREA